MLIDPNSTQLNLSSRGRSQQKLIQVPPSLTVLELSICVVGLTGAGKTSLIERMTKGTFVNRAPPDTWVKGGAIGKKNARISLAAMMKVLDDPFTGRLRSPSPLR